MNTSTVTQWQPFTKHPQADKIIDGLSNIPDDWVLTPVMEKRPYRDGWQSEEPLSKEQIYESIMLGEDIWGKKNQRYWLGYASGYGLRLGDISGGLIAIDIDGASVQQLLNAISDGNFPNTPMWSSGKPGRQQVLFRIPDQYREKLKDFQRQSYTTWNGFHCQEGEQLELRYNNHQSVLPYSYHPETGQYEWLVSPQDTEVAIAPDWVIKLALGELKDPALTAKTINLNTHPRWEQYLDSFQFRSSDSIPLIKCLSRQHRDLAQSGAGEGSRDNTGIAIAMDAVGCENWLSENGQAYDGTAEQILQDYASRCSPPLTEKDANRWLKSAQKSTKGSAIANNLGDDALKSVVASHFWESEKHDFQSSPSTTVIEDNDDDDDKPARLNNKKLLKYIRRYLNLRYNEMTREMEVDGKVLTCEPYLYLLDKHNLDCGKDKAVDLMMMVAKENAYNPVKEYLEKVRKQADPIDISNLSKRYFGTSNPLYDLFVEKTLIGAVARSYNPGCKLDTALVLQGEQGVGKSSFFEVLGGEFFDDSMGNGSDKDDLLTLHRSWIQEWGELDRILGKKHAGEIKQFLSKSQDAFREPYARRSERFLRRGIIVGSVNNNQFLNDPTGARRFWVIPVATDEIDIPTLKKERDQIWAAAVQAYRSGKNWWLTKQEERQNTENNQQFRNQDEWEIQIEEYLVDRDQITVTEILTDVFHYQPKDINIRDQGRVSNCLKALGWNKSRKIYKGKRQVVWEKVLPRTVASMASDSEPTAGQELQQEATDGNDGSSSMASMASSMASDSEPIKQEATDGSDGSDGFSNGGFSETPSQQEVQKEATDGSVNKQTFPNYGTNEETKPWGTENDLSPQELDQLIINYLRSNGETEEYQIICDVQQKSPNVRTSLNRVAIKRQVGAMEKYWRLADD